jgi:environmental stress-induced protein Ves
MITCRVPKETAPTLPTRVQALAQIPIVEWRNGLGGTRVIASAPWTPAPGWRISIATVRANVPFSVLPGVDRVLLPLVPGSLGLVADGVPLPVSADGAIRFDGAREVLAIDGVSGGVSGGEHHVLNVMTPSDAMTAGDRVELRMHCVTGPYTSDYPRTVCVVLRAGEIVTGESRVIKAPAVIPPGFHVDARAAHLVEVVLINPVSTEL